MIRRLWLLLALFVLVGCGEATQAAPSTITSAPPPSIVNGRIVPYTELKLAFQLDGQLAEWLVEPGAVITAGMPLARLDTTLLDMQIAEAEAAVNQASATLDRVRVAASVAQGTDLALEEPAPTPTPNALSNAQIAEAQAALESAKLRHEAAKLQRERATLLAPAAGLLGQHLVFSGEQVGAGQPVAILAEQPQARMWRIKTDDLSELDVGKLAPGQTLTVTIDAVPGRSLSATVAHVEPQPTVERGIVNYTLLLDLTVPEDIDVRWGMSARIQMP